MRRIQLTFSIIFFCLLLPPVLFFDHITVVSESEKRTLAPFPHLTTVDGINFNFFNQIDSYISDRFGFRSQVVSLSTFITADLFRKITTNSGIRGKNRWLFFTDYGRNLNDFLKTNHFSPETTQELIQFLLDYKEFCTSHNIVFITKIVPNRLLTNSQNLFISPTFG